MPSALEPPSIEYTKVLSPRLTLEMVMSREFSIFIARTIPSSERTVYGNCLQYSSISACMVSVSFTYCSRFWASSKSWLSLSWRLSLFAEIWAASSICGLYTKRKDKAKSSTPRNISNIFLSRIERFIYSVSYSASSSNAGFLYVQVTDMVTVPSSPSSIPVVVTEERLSKVRSWISVLAASDLLATLMEKLT